jgi:hypothetical protein
MISLDQIDAGPNRMIIVVRERETYLDLEVAPKLPCKLVQMNFYPNTDEPAMISYLKKFKKWTQCSLVGSESAFKISSTTTQGITAGIVLNEFVPI